MKRLWLILLLSLLAMPLHAQTNQTVVTGIILDPNGVPYYPANITACLNPVTTDPVVNGIHVNPNIGVNYCLQTGTGSTGYFTLYLYPNSAINDGTTQWRFTVSASGASPPGGKGPQTFVSDITISGSSQNVGATLSAASTALLYSAGIASLDFGNTVVVANVLPGGNLQQATCTVTNGSPNISCPNVSWNSSMVGYLVRANTQLLGNAFPTSARVISVTSTTSAVVSANATYSSGGASIGLYPRDETSTINAAIAQANADTNCGTVLIPRGTYLITSAFSALANISPSCYNWGNGSSAGMQIVGFPLSLQGKGTSLVIPADFDWSSCSSGVCFSGGSFTLRCIGFNFTGQQFTALPASAQNKTVASCGAVQFGVHHIGNTTSTTGFQSFLLPGDGSKCISCFFDGTGPVNWGGYFGTFSGYMEGGVYVILTAGANFQMASDGTEVDGISFQSSGAKAYCSQGSRLTAGSIAGTSATVRSSTTGVDLYLDGCQVGSGGVATNAFFATGGNALRVHATHASINGYTNLLNGPVTFYDDCGNTFSGSLASWTSSAGWFGSCSISGTTQTSGNWSTPAGASAGQWGTSPSTASCSGNALVQQCTITVGSGTVGANPVLTVTHPTAFQVAPICDALMVGGTAAFANFKTGTVSATTADFTYNGTPAASSTIQLKVSCSN